MNWWGNDGNIGSMNKRTAGELVIFKSAKGTVKLRGDFHRETIWATQAEMADIFGVNTPAITKHIKNIYFNVKIKRIKFCLFDVR